MKEGVVTITFPVLDVSTVDDAIENGTLVPFVTRHSDQWILKVEDEDTD